MHYIIQWKRLHYWIIIQYGETMKEKLIVENKEVKRSCTTGRVLVPKRYIGKRVNVYVIEEEGKDDEIKTEA